MTQIFREDGTVVPVTRIQAGPCVVTQTKAEKGKKQAVQLGFGKQKLFRLSKPEKGHLKDVNIDGNKDITVRFLHDFGSDNDLKRGDKFTVSIFEKGEKVQVTGTSKGKGFQGVVKRHGFHGGPASHGHKDNLRMPGSIGAGGIQRVFKGKRMGGHMGDDKVTVKNLEIIEVKNENDELLIKGAVPGARNSLVYIFTNEGNIEIKDGENSQNKVSVESVTTEARDVTEEKGQDQKEEKVSGNTVLEGKKEEFKEDKKDKTEDK